MTQIQIGKSESKIQLSCKGHANYSEPGTDIVCAGISTLIFSWAGACDKLANAGAVEIERMKVEPGDADIEITVQDARTYDVFSVIEIGLGLLAENYPECLKIVWGENKK